MGAEVEATSRLGRHVLLKYHPKENKMFAEAQESLCETAGHFYHVDFNDQPKIAPPERTKELFAWL